VDVRFQQGQADFPHHLVHVRLAQDAPFAQSPEDGLEPVAQVLKHPVCPPLMAAL
jgi:hypothetical protein